MIIPVLGLGDDTLLYHISYYVISVIIPVLGLVDDTPLYHFSFYVIFVIIPVLGLGDDTPLCPDASCLRMHVGMAACTLARAHAGMR